VLRLRFQGDEPRISGPVHLSQRDLLTSLKSLAVSSKFGDVRVRVLADLEMLLQQRGLDIDSEGW
jgi:hypothetical protein